MCHLGSTPQIMRMTTFIQYGIQAKFKIGVKMKIYTGTFVKTNGDIRTMRFIRIPDLPKTFLAGKIKNTGKSSVLKEGKELVWDLDKNNFRIFDWGTAVGEPSHKAAEEKLIKSFDSV